ncbi:MAG: neutral zinc metallopeptidase [Myxococcota bacterium]
MDLDGQRRSSNFEDRGSGRAGGGGGGAGNILFTLFRIFGWKGALVGGVVLTGAYFVAPASIRQVLFGGAATSPSSGASSVCQLSSKNAQACDFSRAVLASTEDVWKELFNKGHLPRAQTALPKSYDEPTLVVFADRVNTGGCGGATSAVGPFYCPADRKLYIDPGFYDVMERKLKAPGDFAQAYVIAHEVGHHIQNLIGSSRLKVKGESREETSVRVELQADCFAGVWGHSARADLSITDEDLDEATRAAHAIGDDALGHSDPRKFTHGSSAQRKRWFMQGFKSGDPRTCDTFAVDKSKL